MIVRLPFRPPYDWPALLGFLTARAIDGVEWVEDGVYRRAIALDGAAGSLSLRRSARQDCLEATIHFPALRALPAIVARLRRVTDVAADVETIGRHLSVDPLLAPLIARRPGLRPPGGWDGFELAIRAVLGQQVTVVAARRLASRLVARRGAPFDGGDSHLTHLFPGPERIAEADLSELGMPEARRATLRAVARAALADPTLFEPGATIDSSVARLRGIAGIGEWTAQYIALRAFRESDAFPASDIGLLRGAADSAGIRPTPAALLARAESWRPWRAYAAQHLWMADDILPTRAATAP